MTMSLDEWFEAFLRTKVPSFSGDFLDAWASKTNAPQSFKMSGTTCAMTQCHIPQDMKCAKLLYECQISQHILLFYYQKWKHFLIGTWNWRKNVLQNLRDWIHKSVIVVLSSIPLQNWELYCMSFSVTKHAVMSSWAPLIRM